MILFFDRDIGTSLPRALLALKFDVQFNEVHYHQQHFPMNDPDDHWLPIVGGWGWTVIGHDAQHHRMPNELDAIKEYNIGCFYLWGHNAERWRKMQCFARAYDSIVQAEATTPRPFIFRIAERGTVSPVPI